MVKSSRPAHSVCYRVQGYCSACGKIDARGMAPLADKPNAYDVIIYAASSHRIDHQLRLIVDQTSCAVLHEFKTSPGGQPGKFFAGDYVWAQFQRITQPVGHGQIPCYKVVTGRRKPRTPPAKSHK